MNQDTEKALLLNQINYPDDLRELQISQLPELCKELRQDIIKEVSCNPGHFAASLGTVELTVALHYVFQTPYDRIVWDVGHQAYGHKILTGRRQTFSTNRKLGGIRPFPSPQESEYDTFACGHASNSISAALGMAVAAQLKGEKDRHVVAVIGDGKKYVSALIVPDFDELGIWATKHKIKFTTNEELVNDASVHGMMDKLINEYQKNLAAYEQIKRFVLLPRQFSMENGELTNTLKIKRAVINKRYAKLIDAMYAADYRPKGKKDEKLNVEFVF